MDFRFVDAGGSLTMSLPETTLEAENEQISPIVLAHELRSPLGAAQGFAALIAAQAYGPLGDRRYVEAAKQIEDACRHMESLLVDVVETARREFGDDALKEVDVDLSELVASAHTWLQRDIVAAGVVVRARVALEPVVVRADRMRLRQALLNVLGNAVKYTPRGGRISVETDVDAGAGVVISVENDGVADADGIVLGGTGLGLYVTRRLMRLHGGDLILRHRPEGGLSVRLCLPSARWVAGG